MPTQILIGDFENFVINSSSAKTADELFEHFITSVKRHGYDRIIFSIVNDQDLSPEGKSLGVCNNYPEDWQKYYLEKRFDQIDPVIRYGGMATEGFKWDDIAKKLDLTAKQTSLLEQGKEAGLNNGILIPLRGPRAQLSGFGLASSDKIDACNPHIDLINAYCQQFFLCYKRLFAIPKTEEKQSGLSLTPKETLILTWAASGKTDEDIATILNLSRHTVDTHMRHVFRKLDVTNRIQAVVKAIMEGIITP